MLEMIAVAGDFVAGAVWHRIIQIVTNHKDLQAYAADRLFVTLRSKRAHETAVSVGGYILGEFGYFIAEQASCSCCCSICHDSELWVGVAVELLWVLWVFNGKFVFGER